MALTNLSWSPETGFMVKTELQKFYEILLSKPKSFRFHSFDMGVGRFTFRHSAFTRYHHSGLKRVLMDALNRGFSVRKYGRNGYQISE